MNDKLLELQTLLRENSLLITFSGKFTQSIIEELGEAVKKYLETEERPQNAIFNLFSIFIEQTQNIKNYCSSKENAEYSDRISDSCIVTIGKTETGNYVCSGNQVENQDVQKLVAVLEQVNQMDKEELKKMYKIKRKQEVASMEGPGAGLGLIDIARKVKQPMEYTITELDAGFSFFTLKATV
ncbi:SiaB family protein kinase [Paenibacillus agricola]|uniref:Histidine kinase n=1 Tax=Paenibacillus agricola TaxID=2716264 RepID=A0ABX0J4R9_9BACL|nr:SiaB family protein kinase [Paenibacillus agricola]NHN29111.1 hypothetical protein [Paenibacillus agricola]